jgi:hypothetical protein
MAASLRGREPRSEERPLLEDVTKQRSEDRDCVTVIRVVTSYLKVQ